MFSVWIQLQAFVKQEYSHLCIFFTLLLKTFSTVVCKKQTKRNCASKKFCLYNLYEENDKAFETSGFFPSTKLLSCKLVCFCYYSWVSLSLFLTLGSLLLSNLFVPQSSLSSWEVWQRRGCWKCLDKHSEYFQIPNCHELFFMYLGGDQFQ